MERWILTPTGGRPLVLPTHTTNGGACVVKQRTPAPAPRMGWASRREGQSATTREWENREVTLELSLERPTDQWWSVTHDFGSAPPEAEGDGDLAGWDGTTRRASNDGSPLPPMIADLEGVLAAFHAAGGTATRVFDGNERVTYDVLTGADQSGPAWDDDYYVADRTTLEISLTCAPFGRGAERALATRLKSGANRLLVVNDLQVPGDVPALARIQLGGTEFDQQSLLVAVDQPDAATAAVGVELVAADRPGGSTTGIVASSGAMPDAVAASVRRAPPSAAGTPTGLWEPVSYLRGGAGAPLAVTGTYRVLVRIASAAACTLRLRYAAGSAAAGLSDNGPVRVDATAGAALVDLGSIMVPAGATLDGVLERQTPGTELFVDRWLLIPTASYAVAQANTSLGPMEIVAVDDFARTGALPGSSAPQGGAWVGRGVTPFQTDGTSAWRLAGSGSGAASTLPVPTGPTTVAVSCRAEQACNAGERGVVVGNAAGITALIADGTPPAGAWAVATAVEWDTVSVAGGERIKTIRIADGTRAVSLHSGFREDWSRGHTFSLSIDGTSVRAFMTWPGGSNDFAVQAAAMPAAVEAGIYTIGVFKRQGNADVAQRVDFDDYLVSAQPPPQDRALFAGGRTADISSAASTRTDRTGQTGPIAQHLGDRPLLPPSGPAGRPVRVVAGISPRDIRGGSDPAATATFNATIAVTPRYLQNPDD